MPDYSKSVIYKIYCKDEEIKEIYIGVSCKFSSRRSKHKKNTNNKVGRLYWLKLYKYIRENKGWNNFNMEIIEFYPCNSKEDLNIREKYYIDLYNAGLNTIK